MTDLQTLTDDDLVHGIPPEYRGAILLPGIRETLNAQPTSAIMIGPPGSGKTYQIWAAFFAARKRRLADVLGVAIENTHGLSRKAWVTQMLGKDTMQVMSVCTHILRHRYDRDWLETVCLIPGWLALDDIGFMKPSEWEQEAIYTIANERRSRGQQTLWTTNLKEDGLRSTYSAPIASRLLGGAIIELDGNDRRLTATEAPHAG